jgi:UDP:flavonoid glycosyltransferase YjiC (YdhE family)
VTEPLDILLVTIGSHGDVHPFVGIGRALKDRGHRVRIATNEHFKSLVERAGLGYVQLGSEQLFKQWLDDPDVWHPQKGPQRVMAGVGQTIEEAYEVVARESGTGQIVAGSSLALGALVASEKLGFPYATIHLAPICVRSEIELPTLAGGINFSRFPGWFKRGFWAGGDKWFIDPHIVPPLNALRARLGLAPVSRVLNGYWHSPQLTIGLWPEWFAPRLPDHPAQLRLTGFPLYDEADVTPLHVELDRWLKAGDAPIAFTPGSAMRQAHSFFDASARACATLGRRGMLLTRHADQIPASLPPGVIHVPYAPFGSLLPRVAALVHHGGVGTMAQCLRSGCPQLIMPMSHDQPDNAARCVKLGVARTISRRSYSGRNVADRLRELVDDAHVRAACERVRANFHQQKPVDATCDLIESLAPAHRAEAVLREG